MPLMRTTITYLHLEPEFIIAVSQLDPALPLHDAMLSRISVAIAVVAPAQPFQFSDLCSGAEIRDISR